MASVIEGMNCDERPDEMAVRDECVGAQEYAPESRHTSTIPPPPPPSHTHPPTHTPTHTHTGPDEHADTQGVDVWFSVYTASNGYDWSSIPGTSDRAGLDWFYQKAVAYKPDFMVPGDVVMGVFAYGEIVAAFRIQIVPEWDCYRRSADYCAFAFIPVEDAQRINFEELLERKEFIEPTHEPPERFLYTGSASKDIDTDESMEEVKRLYRGEKLTEFDFGKIGAILSRHRNKCRTWLFSRVDCALDHEMSVLTEGWKVDPYPPPPPPPAPPRTKRQRILTDEIPVPRPKQSRTPPQSSVATRRYTYQESRQGGCSYIGKPPGTRRPVTESELKSAAKLKGKRSFEDWLLYILMGLCVASIVVILLLAYNLLCSERGATNFSLGTNTQERRGKVSRDKDNMYPMQIGDVDESYREFNERGGE